MNFVAAGRIWTEYKNTEVNLTISPKDDMYQSGPSFYFTIGAQGVEAILRGLVTSPIQSVSRVLDVGCNWGRTGRHLRAAFHRAELYFQDITQGALFCAETFNGTPIISRKEIDEIPLPNNIDVVWAGSLFTHFDEQRTRNWLAGLATHLSPGGVIVATFHGQRAYENLSKGKRPKWSLQTWPKAEENGYGYVPYEESTTEWGHSMCKVWKLGQIADEVPLCRVGSITEAGWGPHDVLTLVRV